MHNYKTRYHHIKLSPLLRHDTHTLTHSSHHITSPVYDFFPSSLISTFARVLRLLSPSPRLSVAVAVAVLSSEGVESIFLVSVAGLPAPEEEEEEEENSIADAPQGAVTGTGTAAGTMTGTETETVVSGMDWPGIDCRAIFLLRILRGSALPARGVGS